MQETYEKAITKVFEDEGGYTNDPGDPGGPTNWGITLHDAKEYWLPSATEADMRTMPKSVAEDIYKLHYANPINYNGLPAGIDYTVLDYAINSGVSKSVKTLQEIANVPQDGVMGPTTLQATLALDPVQTINKIWDMRLAYDKALPTWKEFGKGWTNRIDTGRALALSLQKQYYSPSATSNNRPDIVASTRVLVNALGDLVSKIFMKGK